MGTSEVKELHSPADMDATIHKDITTSRGSRYHYHCFPSEGSKPTLLFLHGFPSTLYDWRKRVPSLKDRGFGLIIPDLLDCRDLDQVIDVDEYKYSVTAADMIDILNAEQVDKAFAVGHDWGNRVTSRLASYYPERFLGVGFLAVGNNPPQPDFDLNESFADTKQRPQHDIFVYCLWFAKEGSVTIIEVNFKHFLKILFPVDRSFWATQFIPAGSLKARLLSEQKSEHTHHIPREEINEYVRIVQTNGFTVPLTWYKLIVSNGPKNGKDNTVMEKPVLHTNCKKEHMSLVSVGVQTTCDACLRATVRVGDYDSGHWLPHSSADKFSNDFLTWLDYIVSVSA